MKVENQYAYLWILALVLYLSCIPNVYADKHHLVGQTVVDLGDTVKYDHYAYGDEIILEQINDTPEYHHERQVVLDYLKSTNYIGEAWWRCQEAIQNNQKDLYSCYMSSLVINLYDIDDDGEKEILVSMIEGMAYTDFYIFKKDKNGLKPLLWNDWQDSIRVHLTKSTIILDSMTNGVHDILLGEISVWKWDGKSYKHSWYVKYDALKEIDRIRKHD